MRPWILCAAVLAAPSVALAGDVEIGPYAGLFLPSPKHELYNSAHPSYAPYSSPGVTVGARATYLPLAFLGAEGEVDATLLGTQGLGGATLFGWRAHAIAVLPRDGVQPFAVAGLGDLAVRSPAAANGNDTDIAYHLGLGVRAPVGDKLGWRVDLRDLMAAQRGSDGGVAHHLQLNAGLRFVFAEDEVVPDSDSDGLLDDVDACVSAPETVNGFEDEDGCPDTVPPPPQVEPTGPESLSIDPPDAEAMVWVPHPTCRYLPLSQANTLLSQLKPGDKVQILADGYLPQEVALNIGATPVALQPAPPVGSLVIVAWPRDEVSVGGEPVPVGEDGIAVLTAPEGPVEVTVSGGGREEVYPAFIATAYATWLRVPPPKTQVIHFKVGSAELDVAATATIEGLASKAGAYRVFVQGSASPEGSPEHNLELATSRGLICKQQLIAGGTPADHIDMGPPTIGLSTGDVNELRSCILHPTADEASK